MRWPPATPALCSERVTALGVNFPLTQGILVKADHQRFHENCDLTRVNLGLGWSS